MSVSNQPAVRGRFRDLVRAYGIRNVLVSREHGLAVLLTIPLVVLAADGRLSPDDLKDVATGYLALAAAIFGLVVASLAVIAAFLSPVYLSALQSEGVLEHTLFEYYWVAAESVVALIVAVGLLVVSRVTNDPAVLAGATAIATALFFAALLNMLWLVGQTLRHGVYRELIERVEREIHPDR